MADDRGVEVSSGSAGGWGRPGGDLSRFCTTLAGGAQRARLLLSGVAGPLTDRQRALTADLLRDLEQLTDVAGLSGLPPRVEPQPFDLAPLVGEVTGSQRFVARRRQLILMLIGHTQPAPAFADPAVVRVALAEALGAAMASAPSGGRLVVELIRAPDRHAVDISATSWEPRLPPAPPSGSGVVLSVLRTAAGARLVLSVAGSGHAPP